MTNKNAKNMVKTSNFNYGAANIRIANQK